MSGAYPRADPVVTGIGAVTPLALNAPDTWRALLAGRSGVGPITLFDASGLPVHVAAEVKGFDPVAVLGVKRARRSTRYTQFAVAAAREAVADAGLDIRPIGESTGVVINCAISGAPQTERATRALTADGPRAVSPYYVPSMIANMPACEVAIDLGIHGPVTTSVLACASGNAALLEARRLILTGEADVVVAGGADAGITEVLLSGLANLGPLSEHCGDPEAASRPFDAARDGFVCGEGAVVTVVESAEHAAARGARTYARVAGGALTADAFHISHPQPSGEHAARAIELALARSGLAPCDIDFIVAHGTATRINDVVETRAIHRAFGPLASRIPVSSPKSSLGHMIGAAGALSAMVAMYAIRDGMLSPTINLEMADPECDLDYVPLHARPATVRNAIVNAFGFGGQNCVLVLRAPDAP